MKIAILGLSITSSWGNGHATTWRGLVRELAARGHEVTFLERDVPWYAQNRDLANPPYCRTELYSTLADLFSRYEEIVSKSDLTIVGSYVPDGVAVGDWVLGTSEGLTAFYDIDTPVTIGKLERGDYEYLHPAQIPRYDLYLSFTGGPMLRRLERSWGARRAHALYCSFDPDLYFPESIPEEWALGYLGTYSPDRQPALDELLCRVAESRPEERFAVAGPLYPSDIEWPRNIQRFEHLSPDLHRHFYNSQRATLNVTRADMIRAGYSPSVRLFEAAACGTPIISDYWPGIEDFFLPDREILIARRAEDVRRCLSLPDSVLRAIGIAARTRVMRCHSAARRAADLDNLVLSYTFQEHHSDFSKKQIIPSGAK